MDKYDINYIENMKYSRIFLSVVAGLNILVGLYLQFVAPIPDVGYNSDYANGFYLMGGIFALVAILKFYWLRVVALGFYAVDLFWSHVLPATGSAPIVTVVMLVLTVMLLYHMIVCKWNVWWINRNKNSL